LTEAHSTVEAAFPLPERAPATCFIGVSNLSPDRDQIVAPRLPLSLGSRVHAVRVGDLVFHRRRGCPPDAPLDAAV
jgi:hypothetical protein